MNKKFIGFDICRSEAPVGAAFLFFKISRLYREEVKDILHA